MTHPLEPAIKIFWHNSWMLRNAVADLEPGQASYKMENCNSYDRIVCHIAASRRGLSQSLGIEVPTPDWEDSGDFKLAAQFDESQPCPPVADLMEAFAAISEAMVAGMEVMSLEDLLAPSPMPIPGEDPTLLDLVAFFAMHESYHIGQLAVIGKCMGRKGVMGA
ncbi:MAG: putative damage-inducible protein DinB [Rhodothermales bacterium]|jgi:uncharacterized damage-inducible protein DinB